VRSSPIHLFNCAGCSATASAGWRRRSRCNDRPIPRRVLRSGAGRASLVRALIYPVPDPRFPFLRSALHGGACSGKVDAGPNAVFALAAEVYPVTPTLACGDMAFLPGFPGFLAHGPAALAEYTTIPRRSRKPVFSVRRFCSVLLPEVKRERSGSWRLRRGARRRLGPTALSGRFPIRPFRQSPCTS